MELLPRRRECARVRARIPADFFELVFRRAGERLPGGLRAVVISRNFDAGARGPPRTGVAHRIARRARRAGATQPSSPPRPQPLPSL